MVIHFICNGNVLRSLIAETYLRSLGFKNVETISSGALADAYRVQNMDNLQQTRELLRRHDLERFARPVTEYPHQLPIGEPALGDVVVLMNDIVKMNCEKQGSLPAKYQIWHVTDIGEAGRMPTTKMPRHVYAEVVYHEIVGLVNELVAELQLA